MNLNKKKDISLTKKGIAFFIFVFIILLYPYLQNISLGFPVFPARYAPHPLYAPQEVIVELASWATQEEIQKIVSSFGIKEIRKLCKGFPIFRVKFAMPVQVGNIAAILKSLPLVKYAEPNYYLEAELIPNDPIYIYQWHMGIINMEAAWDIHNGAGVVVAVLDTGVAFRNVLPYAQAPDLAGTIFLPGWDFVNGDAYPDDDNGHGTHIVGTIAQTTNNLYGCAGTAYGCTIMPIKVLDENSTGLLSDVVSGIYYAVDNGAHIINTSFGTVTPSQILQDAIVYASLNGLTIICSAGNGASTVTHYPSSYPECISVSAIKYDKTLAFYSNYGVDIDLCAPGGDLIYDQNLDGKPDGIVQQTHDGVNYQVFNFYIFQGTSCAAAHVAGVAALLIGASGGSLGPDQVKTILESTAEDLGALGWDEYYGWGLVNAAASLLSLPLVATVASSLPLLPIPNLILADSYMPPGTGSTPSGLIFNPQMPWPGQPMIPFNYNSRGGINPGYMPGGNPFFLSFSPMYDFNSSLYMRPWSSISSFYMRPYRFFLTPDFGLLRLTPYSAQPLIF